jgi:flagella basal body P-ring formation protein FlgA
MLSTRDICRRLFVPLVVTHGLCVEAAVIDVRPSGRVGGGVIRLADVAEISDADPLVQRQLQAVTLGPVPPAGRKVRLTQQTIRERLLAHGVNLTEIEFTGQSVVLIETPAEPRSLSTPAASPPNVVPPAVARPIPVRPLPVSSGMRSKAERIVQSAFHRQYHAAANDVGPLSLVVDIPDEDVPYLLRAEPHHLRFVEAGLEWGGPQTLTLRIAETEGATRVVRLQAWLNETPQIVTVKHTVPKGQVLKESDLTRIPADAGVTGLQDESLVVGQEAARDLRPGQPLQSRDVNKVPLVRTNDLVTVRVRSPGLTVSRVFRATSSGAAGDVVNLVALEDPREKIQAAVTGWHEAEMEFPAVVEPSPALQRTARDLSATGGSGGAK